MPVNTDTVMQKLAYSKNLLENGAIAKAIVQSNDPAALERLQKSKAILKAAEEDARAGRLVEADDKIGQALAMVRSAMPNIQTEDAKHLRQLKSYNSRRDSVLAFLTTYDRVAKEKSLGAHATAISREVKARLAKADGLVTSGDVEQGARELEKAYAVVTSATAQLRQGDTLVRELKFETPKDEYLYEIDRNDSLASVLKMTIAEKKPDPRFLAQIEKLKADADKVRAEAEDQANAGRFDQAIETLGRAAKLLITAIRMSGLFIPG
ncbi:MAG: hypothetical protein COW30_08480 [Rhodospirillales bacterium CG15_BIG_FIL_POST_REV_8_21_14_020_66_15]|nr:MAG: hypothetical protein COW30_08480 [Rhodospirillales bacterium CG15_BIG_FIL_POST_REV_8_21_14_020_66_15]